MTLLATSAAIELSSNTSSSATFASHTSEAEGRGSRRQPAGASPGCELLHAIAHKHVLVIKMLCALIEDFQLHSSCQRRRAWRRRERHDDRCSEFATCRLPPLHIARPSMGPTIGA